LDRLADAVGKVDYALEELGAHAAQSMLPQ
jgi:hypothetical protein